MGELAVGISNSVSAGLFGCAAQHLVFGEMGSECRFFTADFAVDRRLRLDVPGDFVTRQRLHNHHTHPDSFDRIAPAG